ncbi:MAG: hypothetical protein K2Y21_16105 [Phycisphaerales bacterium]|nr:hypothetical protein [Phycisphaerales bacterium]
MLGWMRASALLAAMWITLGAMAQRSTPVQVLHPSGAAGDEFGHAVAIDGDTMIVGAPSDSVGTNPDQGSAHVYRWSGSGWAFEATLIANEGVGFDRFGRAVAIHGDTAIVGSDTSIFGTQLANQGVAYIFTRVGSTWTQTARLTANDASMADNFGWSVAILNDIAIVGAPYDDLGTNTDQGSAYVFTRTGTTWTQTSKLVAAVGQPYQRFGASVALSDDTLIVGASSDSVRVYREGSAYVFTRTGVNWTQQAVLISDNGTTGDAFGATVDLSGDTVIVGASGFQNNTGAAYIFSRSGTVWTQQARLLAAVREGSDVFGASVAIAGDTAVVGAPGTNLAPVLNQGSVYIFTRSGTTWTQQWQLIAPDAAENDDFGSCVAIAGDICVVGSKRDDVGANTDQGSAWVFSRVGSRWIGPDLQLSASDGALDDRFGTSVAISGDTAIVGAPNDDVGGNANQGSAYVFVRSGTTWTQQAQLTATGGAANDSFGFSVAVSGNTAIVGAYLDDVGASVDRGSAYVFVRSGAIWTQQAQLTATGGATSDQFGYAVSISGDTALIGAPFDAVGANLGQGSAYVFTRSGTTWTQQAQLNATGGAANDLFGISVALSGDTALVGAYLDDVGANANQGSAYVFVRSGATWSQQAQLTAAGGAVNDNFGNAVALSGDTALVGARADDVNGKIDQGSAYVFVRSGTAWTQQAQLTAADGAAGDQFGYAVGLSGDVAIVGASSDDIGANGNQGSASVFARSGTAWAQIGPLAANGGAANDNYGWSVALSGDTAIVGVPRDDVGANADQGSAWMFDIPFNDLPVVQMLNTSLVAPQFDPILAAALSGNQITGTQAAWRLTSSLDTTGRSLSLLSRSDLRMPRTSVLSLGGDSSLIADVARPIELYGTLAFPGSGLHTISSAGLTLGTQATLTAGAGSVLLMQLSGFDCAIASNTRFDLARATLQLKPRGTEQTLEVMSRDIGPNPSGLDRTIAGQYPIGTQRIGPSSVPVRLVDLYDNDTLGQSAREAIYVDTLQIDAGSRLINPSCKIYYRTLVNNGTIDVPANVIPLSAACPADLNRDAVVDDLDFQIFSPAYNILDCGDASMPSGCPADLNRDNVVDDLDFQIFVVAYDKLLCD